MKVKMYLILEGFLFISMAALIFVFENNLAIWTVIFKSIASFFFVLIGLCGYRNKKEDEKFFRFMLTAFICSMAGDVFLALDKNEGILFIFGVISFAAAHIIFSAAFCRIAAIRRRDVMISVLVFAGLMPILFFGNFDFQGLLPVLIGYAAVISFMMTKALSLWYCRQGKERSVYLLMIGGVLFLVSDVVLLFWLFGAGAVPKEVQSVNWFFYYLSQGCLSAALNVPEKNGGEMGEKLC